MTPVLELCHLRAGYTHPILHDISLSVERGELVCLLGENGCGKTTLFRAVLGGARRFGGEIFLSGQNIDSLSVRKRARLAALVAQLGTVVPGLRVSDVIAMGSYAAHQIHAETLREIAARFGVADLWERDFSTLSAGQRQLVHLARAAVQNTPMLFLDEPSSALDFANTHLLFVRLAELLSAGQCGALAVVHDPALALNRADRIFTMKDGCLLDEIHPRRDSVKAVHDALSRLYPGIRLLCEPDSGLFFCDIADVADHLPIKELHYADN